MAYNYAKEKRKFDAEWKINASWYRKEGMSEEDIAEMYRFDLAQFNRDRAYENRRSPLEGSCDSLCLQPDRKGTGRYGWLDEISDPDLSIRLRELSEGDLELITLVVVDGLGVREISRRYKVAHSTISRKLTRIKKFLKNF